MNFSVYDYMIAFLSFLSFIGLYSQPDAAMHFIVIAAAAVIADFVISFIFFKKKQLPKSAIISGLIIALILEPSGSITAKALAALIAILSKHLIKLGSTNVFNPAAFSLLLSNVFLGTFSSWWAASTAFSLPLGLFISYKIRKLEISLAFLLSYFLLFTLFGYVDIIRELGGSASLFLAFFMLTEPKTSPHSLKGKYAFGILAAAVALVMKIANINADFLLLGLLVSNLFAKQLDKLTAPANRLTLK